MFAFVANRDSSHAVKTPQVSCVTDSSSLFLLIILATRALTRPLCDVTPPERFVTSHPARAFAALAVCFGCPAPASFRAACTAVLVSFPCLRVDNPPPVLFLPPAENRHERRNALHSDAVDRSSSAEPCNGSWSVGSVDAESFDVHARRSRKELCVWFAVASCLCRCIVCAVLRVKTVPPPALLLKLYHLHGFKPGHSRSVLAPVFCCHGRTQLRCVYSYWLELFSWNCRQAGDMFSPCAVSLGSWLMAPSSGMAIPESLPRGDVREFRLIFKRRRRFFLIFSFVCIRPKPNKSCLS